MASVTLSPGVQTSDGGQRPSQIKFWRPGQMALFAKIAAYPPLGSVTVVPPSRKQFEFTVVIESSASLPEQPWEVAIWYDHSTCYATNTGEWRALSLQKAETPPTLLYDNRGTKLYRHAFEGSLPTPFPEEPRTYKGRMVPFTVRYRINANEEWTWVHENFGTSDGQVILQPPLDKDYLGAGPVELKDWWHTRKLRSEAPGASLYSFESSATIPYNGTDAKDEFIVLGKVFMTHKWFALVRIWSPWLAPRHGSQHFRLNEPAILLSFLRTDGQHIVVLAVNGIDDVLTTLRSDGEGNIMVAARNDTGKDRKFRVLAARSYNFEIANAAVMYEMRKLVRESAAYQTTAQSLPTHIRHESLDSEADTILITNIHDNRNPADDNSPTPQWLASWYDSLSYCTWNSLGQDLNLEKIIAALQHFQDNKINIANMIIDDNWQSLTGTQGVDNQFHRAMTAFEATPHCFPNGLKSGITEIRTKFPHLRDIAVWHALMGYWGCISHDTGHLHTDYKLRAIRLADGSPAAGTKHAIDPKDIHRFYSDFYAFLSESGITAVKTDAQFFLDLLASTADRRDMTNSFLSAWTQAHLTHLSGKAISCMSQIPQILYHSFLPTNTPRIMLRNSDDFFPDVPTSHPWHVFANAHNSLFVQHLNVLPDWDMFQTSHVYSGFHAAARCVSGGPIYITDYPGQSDVKLIHEMTARNPRGDTVILRPSSVGKTIGVYDSYESGAVLKVGAYDGRAEVGTGILGVFNVAEQEVNFVIPITKIPGVTMQEGEKKRSWLVRSHLSSRITRPITPTLPLQGRSLLQANLPVRGYDVWTCIPVHGPYSIGERKLSIAVMGLIGKMTGACALVNSRFSSTGPADSSLAIASEKQKSVSGRLRIDVETKALGVLGIWVSSSGADGSDVIDVDNDLLVLMKGHVVPRERVKVTTEGIDALLTGDGGQPGLIEIDAEGAWDDLNLDAGWNNEVGVEVYIA
ncbi:hypothetical protein H2198_008735 [Neophaeococcomyces mojaviensis]|uniref:Uncharacterized protein n=1 Tax=Neophaeococcomyces mojaviensis TaxID=3383035 RepID=A0ACC2ZWP7_9EURO|nr:hypothetical protein H2198_008735 [Knufia sp. JES_112]